MFWENDTEDTYTHTEIYLIGTSQKANVLIEKIYVDNKQGIQFDNIENEVTYEEKEGYGIISIYRKNTDYTCLVSVEVDGYTYQFIIETISPIPIDGYFYRRFHYAGVDKLPKDYVIEECSIDEIITHQATDSSALVANSRTYHTNNDWIERVGTKFVQELEDQAIEMVAGAVLKWLLPF